MNCCLNLGMTLGVQNKQFHGKVTVKNEAVAMQAPKRASIINCIQKGGNIQQTNWGASASLFLLPSCFQFPFHDLVQNHIQNEDTLSLIPTPTGNGEDSSCSASSSLATNSSPGVFSSVKITFLKKITLGKYIVTQNKQTNKQAKIWESRSNCTCHC